MRPLTPDPRTPHISTPPSPLTVTDGFEHMDPFGQVIARLLAPRGFGAHLGCLRDAVSISAIKTICVRSEPDMFRVLGSWV